MAFVIVVACLMVAAAIHGEEVSTNAPVPRLTDTSAQQAVNYLDKLVQFNDKLLGLPALPFLIVGCIALCYSIKGMPFVGNTWIPFWNFVFGILGYSMLGLLTVNFKAQWYIVLAILFKNAVIGMIGSALAWRIHTKVLKPLEKRLGWDSDTDILLKGKTAQAPSNPT